jgi:quinol monooxygenase YgiN
MALFAQSAKYIAKPGRGGKIVAALESALAAASLEDGTLVYAIHRSTDHPDVVWMYELYADPDAHGSHSVSTATSILRSATADLVAQPLSVVRGPVHQSFGLPGDSMARILEQSRPSAGDNGRRGAQMSDRGDCRQIQQSSWAEGHDAKK